MSRQDALGALWEAMHYLDRARSVLGREAGTQPLFTRREAIADATAKLAQFGPLGQTALRSLIHDWEQEERATMEACLQK